MSGMITYAQCGEDIIMLFLAKHVLGLNSIYYLDIGANDPVHFNNTHLFYEEGFNGLSVDANPYFEKLHRTARPKAHYITCGIGNKSGKAVFYQINPHTLSTFSKAEADRYVKDSGHEIVSTKRVKIKTIDELLSKDCAQTPNVLSLDVEGMDFQILQAIDFSQWRPAIICVETITYAKHGKQMKLDDLIQFIVDKGYQVYADTYINTIFVDNESWEKK